MNKWHGLSVVTDYQDFQSEVDIPFIYVYNFSTVDLFIHISYC